MVNRAQNLYLTALAEGVADPVSHANISMRTLYRWRELEDFAEAEAKLRPHPGRKCQCGRGLSVYNRTLICFPCREKYRMGRY